MHGWSPGCRSFPLGIDVFSRTRPDTSVMQIGRNARRILTGAVGHFGQRDADRGGIIVSDECTLCVGIPGCGCLRERRRGDTMESDAFPGQKDCTVRRTLFAILFMPILLPPLPSHAKRTLRARRGDGRASIQGNGTYAWQAAFRYTFLRNFCGLPLLDQRGAPGGAQAGRLRRAGMGTCPATGQPPVDRGRRGHLPILRHETLAGTGPTRTSTAGRRSTASRRRTTRRRPWFAQVTFNHIHPEQRLQFEHLPGRSRVPLVERGCFPIRSRARWIVRRRRPATK